MPKFKTFTTEQGFFELAVAAPSRAAALRAWGMKHDLFAQGLARQTEDKSVIAATLAQPGVVLRRPLGS
ncbi:MAG TPA: cell envelope biogenesis protein TolA, partial [Rhizomicrobium sp.]